MTTLRLDKRHRAIAEKVFAENEIRADFYNMENIEACRVFIHCDESDTLFILGIAIGQEIAHESMKNII